MTTTPVAPVGPRFVAVTMNVTVVPTVGVALSTVFVTAMSAAGWPFTTAAATLLLASGSG